MPAIKDASNHVWHLFVVKTEERLLLKDYLDKHNIQSLIHYPIAPHHQKAYEELKSLDLPIAELLHKNVLSIPMDPTMTQLEVDSVIDVLNGWKI